MVGAALGVADNDGAGAGIRQHFRRNVAGMGPERLGVAILRADRDGFRATGFFRESRNQRRRRANQ